MTAVVKGFTTIAVRDGTRVLFRKFVINNEFSSGDDALRALIERWEGDGE